ncbi:MAG: hypothetical protein ACYTG4_13840, partial [Planctomycetota bacterium]
MRLDVHEPLAVLVGTDLVVNRVAGVAVVLARQPLHLLRLRLDGVEHASVGDGDFVPLQRQEERDDGLRLCIGETEVRHDELLERLLRDARVPYPRVLHLQEGPLGATVRNELRAPLGVLLHGPGIVHHPEIEAINILAAPTLASTQLGPAPFGPLEAGNVVARVAHVAGDGPLAHRAQLLVAGHRIDFGVEGHARLRAHSGSLDGQRTDGRIGDLRHGLLLPIGLAPLHQVG